MGLNDTPNADRIHIGIFGRRNAGKSSLINAITGQDLAVVSDISGTTTDPVSKAMELLPLGPVLMIDTPGIDDEGELGKKRVQRSYSVLNKTDIAVLVINAAEGFQHEDLALLERIHAKKIPCVVALNKADLLPDTAKERADASNDAIKDIAAAGDKAGNNITAAGDDAGKDIAAAGDDAGSLLPDDDSETGRALSSNGITAKDMICVSSRTGWHIWELKEMIAAHYKVPDDRLRIVGDLLSPGDLAVLVIPIDSAAPKGRLILPQQQTIRDILEADATAVVCREYELKNTLEALKRRPRIVITDSQAFEKVSADTPDDILLTSFSILMARAKGNLKTFVKGVRMLNHLKDGDPVLISEGCTHHRQCDDIGSVKLPRWIRNYTGAEPDFHFTSGGTFPDDPREYKMIIHCGGCTLNRREMQYRIACAEDAGVPITNYGILIAYIHGILARSVQAFPDIAGLLNEVQI